MSDGAAVTPTTRALRQTLWLSVAAVVAFVVIRSLPVDRGVLHYDDFGVGQPGALEFCEPGGPQFVPVDRVQSPVVMTLGTDPAGPVRPEAAVRLTVRLTAASGKPVTSDDLLVAHTQKLHLLVIDPSLEDYQHLHPVGTDTPGEFSTEFTPRRGGEYRVFADFVPRATGRALYAGARLQVGTDEGLVTATAVARSGRGDEAGEQRAPKDTSSGVVGDKQRHGSSEASVSGQAAAIDETREVVVGEYRFALSLDPEPPRINEIAELRLAVHRADGAQARLEEIMGARAHVVAFDLGRSGFAHLHPIPAGEGEGDGAPLRFQLSLNDPGTYRLWAQVRIDGREIFAPFTLGVRP